MAAIWPKWCRTSCGLRRFRSPLLSTLIGSWWAMWMSSWLLSQLLTERYILKSSICPHDFEALFTHHIQVSVLTCISHHKALIYPSATTSSDFNPFIIVQGFRMLLASPDAAYKVFRTLQNKGHGNLKMFTGEWWQVLFWIFHTAIISFNVISKHQLSFILTGTEEEVSVDEILSNSGFQAENNYVQVSDLVQISRTVNIEAHRWYSKVLSLTIYMWSCTKLNRNEVLKSSFWFPKFLSFFPPIRAVLTGTGTY